MIPHFKLTVGATTIIDDYALSIENRRPENNISSLVVQVDDYQSKSYVDLFDVHTQIELWIACKNAGYTKTFSGLIHNLKPTMNDKGGEVLEVQAWGWGVAFAKTTCDTSFGTESANPLINTPVLISGYIIANEVKKRWAGGNTLWELTPNIENVHPGLLVTNLTGNYVDNFTLINRLCDIINAYAVANSDISVHWYVDTDKNFRLKEIDQDSTDGLWKRYYGGNAAAATFKEKVDDVLSRGFHRHIEDYYNSIVLASAFRKPAQDVWCEDNGPAWGNFQSTDTYSLAQKIVGSHSLQITPTVNNDPAVVFYPSSHDADWDFTMCGSPNTIPHLSFYIWVDDATALQAATAYVVLGKDWGLIDGTANDIKFAMDFGSLIANPQDDKWFHVSIPIGPYYAMAPELANTNAEWIATNTGGTARWDDIDFVAIGIANLLTTEHAYVDDLHFSGKIVRHCYDATEITPTNKERQLLMRLDTALDDTLEVTFNTGTAARLCAAELYKRTTMPVVGTLSFPCIEDMLPGQTLRVYAGLKSDGVTYRWSNLPMRVKELIHRISPAGYVSTVELTSDVTNSNVAGVPNAWGLLMDHAGALGHGEAKDLKAAGIDNLIPRLSWDPT